MKAGSFFEKVEIMQVQRRFMKVCGLLAAIMLMPGAETIRAAGLREAVAVSKQTGKPVLVLGLNPTCPHCEQLKKRIADEPELQALVAQYVITQTTSLQDPDALVMLKNYPPKVAGTPVLIGIAPNGVQLFNQAGAPEGDNLLKLLEEGLAKSAQIMPPRPAVDNGADVPQARGKRGKKVIALVEKSTATEEPAKPSSAKKDVAKGKKATPSASEKAANFLKMARKFSDPEKIKKYAEKAIAAAPDSPHAAAAQELIEGLD